MSARRAPDNTRQQKGNPGCCCLLIVIVGVGIASFFAIARGADFPGADTLRSAGREGEELYQQARQAIFGDDDFTVPAPTPMPSVSRAPTPVSDAARRSTSTARPAAAPSRANRSVQQPRPTRQSTPVPTVTSTLNSTRIPTVEPTLPPTATPPPPLRPDQRHYELKLYMLELINKERTSAGVPPVTLGENIAAQLHAENSLASCFSGHWGVDGLKPYMRYSLAGGYQTNGENGSGSNYCIKASDRYRALRSIGPEVRDMMEGWVRSPGHRRNILDKWHKKVNIGLAWDKYNMVGYQHFEGGFVQYSQLPEITNGRLSLSGRAIGGLRFPGKEELGFQIYYDPPPYSLTRGQVSRTYCYDSGLQIAAFRYPLTNNSFWTEDMYTKRHSPCPDPYDVSLGAPAPRSPDEAHRFWEQAYAASQAKSERTITVPWITASKWTARGTDFSVAADVRNLLSKYGAGVYTILLWGEVGGEDVPISEYSIFYEVEPPDTYNPECWK